MKRPKRLWRRADGGGATVEAAVVMAVLLLLLAGSLEFAQALWTYNTMLLAVAEAGRYAMAYNHRAPMMCGAQTPASNCPAASATPIANCSAWWAQQVLSAYQMPNIGVSVSEDTTSTPTTITVCASTSLELIGPPLFPRGPIDLIRQVTVPVI
jgi:Flp pilus assembly protein TadG